MWNNFFSVEETLQKRKSVRQYLDKKISQEMMVYLKRLAMEGPISGGIDCVEIYEVQTFEEMKLCYKASHYQEFIKNAPHVLIFGCREEALKEKYNAHFSQIFSCQNATIAAQNFILAAEGIGLATCFIGALRQELFKEFCWTNQATMDPWCIVTIGYPL